MWIIEKFVWLEHLTIWTFLKKAEKRMLIPLLSFLWPLAIRGILMSPKNPVHLNNACIYWTYRNYLLQKHCGFLKKFENKIIISQDLAGDNCYAFYMYKGKEIINDGHGFEKVDVLSRHSNTFTPPRTWSRTF